MQNNNPKLPNDTKLTSLSMEFCCILIAVLIIAVVAFLTGKLVGNNNKNPSALISSKQNEKLEMQLSNATARLSMAEITNQINSKALEETRQTIVQLEQQIYLQQKQIIALQNIIAKQNPSHHLAIRDFIIHATNQPQLFKYKLVLTRTDQPKLLLKGSLQITIEGILDKKAKTLTLAEVTNLTQHKNAIFYSFRYMEMIPANSQFAELILPKNFTPKKLKIIAHPNDGESFTKEFKWNPEPLPMPLQEHSYPLSQKYN